MGRARRVVGGLDRLVGGAAGDELEVVELVGDQPGRRRAGADAQVVAQRAFLSFRLVGQARHDALDDALFAAGGTVDRIALAGKRHAVQAGEAAAGPDGAACRGGGAGADIETFVGHVRSRSGESWNVAQLGWGVLRESSLVWCYAALGKPGLVRSTCRRCSPPRTNAGRYPVPQA